MYPTQVLTFVDSLESLYVIMPTTTGLQLSPQQQLQEQNIFQASQLFFDSADTPLLSAPAKPLSIIFMMIIVGSILCNRVLGRNNYNGIFSLEI